MDVLMPQLGETVAEGKITKWFKSAGDAVKPGDNLFEIETDKVSMEVPSTTTGQLAEIRVPAGEVAPVGAIVAVISDGSAAAASTPAAANAATPPTTPKAAPVTSAPPPQGPLGQRIRHGAARIARGPAARRQRADCARSVLRGAHARAQLRPGAAARRHRCHPAGAPVGR